MTSDGHDLPTPFNVLAAFPRRSDAEAAATLLVEEGIPSTAVSLHDRAGPPGDADDVASLRAEMQEELVNSWAAPAFLMTGPQAKGAFWGTVIFTALGLVVGLVIGLVWIALARPVSGAAWRIVLTTLLGGLAGGTVGFLAGGGLKPRVDAAADPGAEMEDPRPAAERDVLLAVHSGRRDIVERAAHLLRAFGADRVDLVDAGGTPLPPQSEHPRPADPPGWWWRRAGHG
jgi:hypothetical protein